MITNELFEFKKKLKILLNLLKKGIYIRLYQ